LPLLQIVLSLLAGNVLATGISEAVLQNNILAALDASIQAMNHTTLSQMDFGVQGLSPEEVLATYSALLDGAIVVTFLQVAISVVLVATVIPMLYVLRLNSRKIML